MEYGISKQVNYGFSEAVEKVTEELKKEGFGILTSIDVKKTLKAKIDVDFTDYVILGACNPPLAHRALSSEMEIGLLLPCNIVVYVNKDENTMVSAFDPMLMSEIISNATLQEVAGEVREKLKRVIEAL
jgi:uncharacterized protein (DUF302 family)